VPGYTIIRIVVNEFFGTYFTQDDLSSGDDSTKTEKEKEKLPAQG